MNQYRLTKQQLWDVLEQWDEYVSGQVRLIACGGTALTLQDLKPSTKDVDFLVPDEDEHRRLIQMLKKLNYREIKDSGWKQEGSPFIFDIYKGKTVFKTELRESPLEPGRFIPVREFKRLMVGALNDADLIITKMFRGDEVDVQDCVALIRGRGAGFDLARLKDEYAEAAKDDIVPEKMMKNLDRLLVELGGGDA